MIIYKTTNLVNGKIYIGQDSKNNPNYLGSGKLIKYAILKYGIANFVKEVIESCNSKNELNEKERYWIKTLKSQDMQIGYNIKPGGEGVDPAKISGPNNHMWHNGDKIRGEKNPNYGNGDKISGEKNCQYGLTGEKSPNWGRKNTDETKQKMSESAKKVHNGTRTDEERAAIKKGMAKNKPFFIRQISKETGEIIADYVSTLEAKNATGITYWRIAANNHKEYEFIKIFKNGK
jgi:group I intron endonuclease